MNFLSNLWAEIMPILITALTALVSVFLTKATSWVAAKLKSARDDIKSDTVMMVVKFVEQALKDATSTDKLRLASMTAAKLLSDKGIKIEEDELTVLIEQTVKTFNDTYWGHSEAEDTPIIDDPVIDISIPGTEDLEGSDEVTEAITEDSLLTPHFKLKEFKCSCGGKHCNGYNGLTLKEAYDSLKPLAEILELGRAETGKPVIIKSGIRCPAQNAAVGGTQGSWHTKAVAADVSISGVDSGKMWDRLNPNGGVGYGGGHYPHVDVRGYKARWKY